MFSIELLREWKFGSTMKFSFFAIGFCLFFNFRAKIPLRLGVMNVKRVARVKSMSSSLVAVSGSIERVETDVRRKICCPTIKTFENFVCFHHRNCVSN